MNGLKVFIKRRRKVAEIGDLRLKMGIFLNEDCLEGMKRYPDKYFDLAIVDPPYGININNNMGRRKGDKKSDYPKAYWDKKPVGDDYFSELFRVSKKAIIWGGNYYSLPPAPCFIIWRKPHISENVTFSMCEYAWTNLEGTSKEWIGMSNEKDRFHPTQKPIALYKWLLQNYAKPGDIILDTHVGSASSLIACEELGFDYVGFEINEKFYQMATQRINEFNQQVRMF